MKPKTEQTDQIRWIAVLAAIGVALYLCWLMLRPFITVLVWAAVLVIVFYPVHKRIVQKLSRRGLSAILSTTLVVLVFVLPLVFLTMAVTNELVGVVSILPAQMDQLMNPTGSVGRISSWVRDRLGVDASGTQAFMVQQLKTYGSAILARSIGLVGNVLSTIVKAFFVIITMYYLFRDGDQIVKALPGAMPFGMEQSEALLTRTSQVISASVYGVVSIALLQGVLGGLAFWAFGVPSTILWAVVLAFVCLIPLAGSFFVWLPIAIYLMMTGHITKGILLILWGALVISTVDNLLRPKLMKDQTRLHELFVFFSVLGGISMFGLLGIVLGPVILAVTLGLLESFKFHTVSNQPE